jgi:DNA replicative helicase MCM subunit Mcm2 (Cdc46/Mcm family)
MLERGKPQNPNPYAKSNLGNPIEIDDAADEDEPATPEKIKDVIKRVGEQYPDAAGAPEQDVLLVMRNRFEMNKERASSTIESLQNKGEVYRPTDTTLKVV